MVSRIRKEHETRIAASEDEKGYLNTDREVVGMPPERLPVPD